jgi:DNA-binding CsgD family transcriptional regulator
MSCRPSDAYCRAPMAEGGQRSGIVGRDDELAIVDEFLERAAIECRVLAVEGVAGIGKTTLWWEAISRASAQGFRVLSCRPVEAETALAATAVADLLHELPDAALVALPPPQQRALRVALLQVDPETATLDARAVAAAFRSLLVSLHGDRPVLVAVDDEQWLDRASATTLGFALRRLTTAPIGWLLTHRIGQAYRLDVDQLAEADRLRRVTVGPMSLAAVHELLKVRLERSLARPALVRIHHASGGNPLYALEIAREYRRQHDGVGAEVIPVPENLRSLIASQLRRLPRRTRHELVVCSALASPSVDVVDEVALAPAVEGDIVGIDRRGRVTFRHPLYASIVYESTSPTARREIHNQLAELVDDREERARHLVLGAGAPSETVACAAESGAALSRGRGSWETAAELFEHAARLTPPERSPLAQRRTIAAAEHHIHAGDRQRARMILEDVLADPLEGGLRAEALRLLAEVSYNDDHFVQASQLYRKALAVADDPRAIVEILLGLSYVDAQLWEQLWDFPGAATQAHRALELAKRIGDEALLAEALGYCAMLDFLCGRGLDRDKVARAVELEEPDRLVPVERRPSTMAALLALYDGRHDEARTGLAAVCTAARLRGDESDLPFVVTWQSWLETRAGNYRAAGALADESASLATLTGSRSMHAWALSQRAYVHAHRGEIENTRRLCAEAAGLLESSGYLQPGMWIAASLTVLELSLANAADAWQACRPLVEALEGADPWEPIIAFVLPDALETLIALGEHERAEPLIEAFEGRGRHLRRTWAVATGLRCRGLLHAASGDLVSALAALDQADAHHHDVDVPFDHARTLLVKGRIERRLRRRGDAHTSVSRALESFDRLGATIWCAQARAELRGIRPRRTESNELTHAERNVAELAVNGHTNRQIATQLFMSRKTVEAHVAHIYRKFGIHSRAELGARLAAQRGAPTLAADTTPQGDSV